MNAYHLMRPDAHGFSLIETLLYISLLSLVMMTICNGLAGASAVLDDEDERATIYYEGAFIQNLFSYYEERSIAATTTDPTDASFEEEDGTRASFTIADSTMTITTDDASATPVLSAHMSMSGGAFSPIYLDRTNMSSSTPEGMSMAFTLSARTGMGKRILSRFSKDAYPSL